MRSVRDKLLQQSINDYLDLTNKVWLVEFEVTDFGASLSKILELPLTIYKENVKAHFWAFLKVFLQKCEIGFILKQSIIKSSNLGTINLALIGYWEEKQYAIPLWILKDILLGFEIIASDSFLILDSEPHYWSQPILISNKIKPIDENSSLILFSEDIFIGQKIYFKLDKGQIFVSDYFNELEFFKRIAQTEIPDLDEISD
ncbi:MAG: hypothetical protein ACFFDT_08100 [Candidatus Hodarchaeota archaeon]